MKQKIISISTTKQNAKWPFVQTLQNYFGRFLKSNSLEQQNKHLINLDKQVKELSCLYEISKLFRSNEPNLQIIFNKIVGLIQHTSEPTADIGVCIKYGDDTFITNNYPNSIFKQTAPITVQGKKVGSIEMVSATTPLADTKFINILSSELGQHLEQIQDTEELRTNEKQYRHLFQNSEEAIAIIQNGQFMKMNPKTLALLGYTKEELLAVKREDTIYPEDKALVMRRHALRMDPTKPEPEKNYEFRILTKAGNVRWVALNTSRIMWMGKLAALSNMRDITYIKNMQDELSISMNKFIDIFENIQTPYYESTAEGIIMELSPSIKNILHYSREELIGKSVFDLLAEPTQKASLIKKLTKEKFIENFEVQLKDLDGSVMPVLINARLLTDSAGSIIKIVGSIQDITEIKKLQQELIQQTQKGLLSKLATGFGHNFRNILAGISGVIEEIIMTVNEQSKLEIGEETDLFKRIHGASQAINRAVNLVNMVIEIGQPIIENETQNINLNELITKFKTSANGNITTFIETKMDLAPNLPLIKGHTERINNLLWQLLLNAVQAIQDHSNQNNDQLIKITTSIETKTSHTNLKPGNYVVLRISDTGVGMTKQEMSKIFDFFYTNRHIGKNSGIGLNVAQIIAEQHGGIIEVEKSVVGEGTTFTVYFPAAELKEEIAISKLSDTTKIKTKNKTVLIVDDEEMIRDFYQAAISNFLHLPTLHATSTDEAIEVFKANHEHIGLVYLDLGLPGKGGNHCLTEFNKINPNIAVIINSGYPKNSPEARVDGVYHSYLQKPVSLDTIRNLTAEIIDLENNK
ncbi:MAG: hypothetical protein A2Y40_02185 [Candidatus Margulisbacteria bacterium GWF2_35_9]|nr:MAG: hypothetical protein A2Y40_02185 [Candidatus Margulisbacteria bacterium GWF2_35_9]